MPSFTRLHLYACVRLLHHFAFVVTSTHEQTNIQYAWWRALNRLIRGILQISHPQQANERKKINKIFNLLKPGEWRKFRLRLRNANGNIIIVIIQTAICVNWINLSCGEREIVAQHKPTANINAKYTILFALCERKRHKGTAQKRRKIDWHKSAARTFKMPINYWIS